MSTDNELMAEVKNGDLEKLAVLYEKYNRPLFAFFYKMTSDSQASEDLVHVVFCKVLSYRDRFRENEGTFAVWLFQIARNARIDHYHKEKHLRNAADVDGLEVKSEADTAGDYERSEKARRMREALNVLTEAQRETLILSRFNGLGYEEIARIMNCRVGTIKARVFRAMETLRQSFGDREKSA
ncbi:MAG: RNA polymerase sigma factor [Candidatus Aminicenantes bacterium]|nr:RNA polymerase sigma factor [Candidatus Aminicenantes bacterium]